MVKVYSYKRWKWYCWPLTEDEYLRWQKPAHILLRIKLVSLVMCGMAAFYLYLNRLAMALAFVLSAVAVVATGVWYYKAVKSGRIIFKK